MSPSSIFSAGLIASGILMFSFSPVQAQAVKLSDNGNLCHAAGTEYYNRTTNFIPYDSVQDCIDAGGRMPRGQSAQSTVGNRVSNTLYDDGVFQPPAERAPTSTQANTNPQVKKSTNNICHDNGSEYYARTQNFEPYPTMDACIASGGRLPEGEGRQTASSGPFGRIDNVFTRPNPDESIEGVTIRYGFPVIADNSNKTVSNFSLNENQ